MMESGSGLVGITGLPAYTAFKKAGISFEIRQTPFARQLRMLEKDAGQDCMIGMFKKPEREVFAKFTKPIYRDQTQVILTEESNARRLASVHSVEDLFNDKGIVFLAKLGYSYGAALDAMIEKHQPKIRQTADENLLMIKAIKLKMADYMVIAPEEATEAIVAAGFEERDFKQIKLKNMPAGEHRHIMCSKYVSDEVIKKLNAAIDF
jgi:polar amino acid transport system substrate-binding protein